MQKKFISLFDTKALESVLDSGKIEKIIKQQNIVKRRMMEGNKSQKS